MKRIIVFMPFKRYGRNAAYTLLLLFLLAVLVIIAARMNKNMQASTDAESAGITELEKENSAFRSVLSSILPKEDKVLYEDEHRLKNMYTVSCLPPAFKEYPLQNVMAKGKILEFNILLNDRNYLRPVYDSEWKDCYFRGWLDLTNKVMESRHRLYIYPVGLSSTFDFEGSLGFERGIAIDTHRNMNFLVYNFSIKKVSILGNQITLFGEPQSKGVQIISVKLRDILPPGTDSQQFLFQLSTPGGYEVDYLYEVCSKTEFYKKMEEEGCTRETFLTYENEIRLFIEENARLKEELAYFIPFADGIIPQEENISAHSTGKLSNIKAAWEKGKSIKCKTIYLDKEYKRPVYHPFWKQNCKKGWCYIPDKVNENMHKLFVIPEDPAKWTDLAGSLGFYESIGSVEDDEIGLLVYNFIVEHAVVYKQQIVLSGKPSRNGAHVISLDCSSLKPGVQYTVQLATPDNRELDFVVAETQ